MIQTFEQDIARQKFFLQLNDVLRINLQFFSCKNRVGSNRRLIEPIKDVHQQGIINLRKEALELQLELEKLEISSRTMEQRD